MESGSEKLYKYRCPIRGLVDVSLTLQVSLCFIVLRLVKT